MNPIIYSGKYIPLTNKIVNILWCTLVAYLLFSHFMANLTKESCALAKV